MGRRRGINNDVNEQQLASAVCQASPNSIKHESQRNLNQDIDEHRINDDDSDPLIHDTILPYRKRVRKDTIQSIQLSQLATSCKILNVSRLLFALLCFAYFQITSKNIKLALERYNHSKIFCL